MMLEILHNVEPNCCDIKFKVTPRQGDVAIIPSLSKSSSLRNQSLYDRYFAVEGLKLCNKVPHTANMEYRSNELQSLSGEAIEKVDVML